MVNVGDVTSPASCRSLSDVPIYTRCFTARDAGVHERTAVPVSSQSTCIDGLAGEGSDAVVFGLGRSKMRALMPTDVVWYVVPVAGTEIYSITTSCPFVALNVMYDMPHSDCDAACAVCVTFSSTTLSFTSILIGGISMLSLLLWYAHRVWLPSSKPLIVILMPCASVVLVVQLLFASM